MNNNIQVRKENRTFERVERDIVNNLEQGLRDQRRYDDGASDTLSSISSPGSRSGTVASSGGAPRGSGVSRTEYSTQSYKSSTKQGPDGHMVTEESHASHKGSSDGGSELNGKGGAVAPRDFFDNDDFWSSDMSAFVRKSRERWDRKMDDLNSRMFSLEGDNDPFGRKSLTGADRMNNLEREMQQMMNSTSRSSKQFSSSLLGDSTFGSLDPPSYASSTGGSRALLPATNRSATDDMYEVGEDGLMHFKVRFNAEGFASNDINVSSENQVLHINARKEVRAGNSVSEKELRKSVTLPAGVDPGSVECCLTTDGVLIVDAPVQGSYQRGLKSQYHQRMIDQRAAASDNSSLASQGSGSATASHPGSLTSIGKRGKSIMLDERTGKQKLHIEEPVDGMERDDVSVRFEDNKIYIEGLIKTANSSSRFTKSYEVPPTLDPSKVRAEHCNNLLILEAPL